MIWVKTMGYLVVVSMALINQKQQSRREYTLAEKAILSELCEIVTLDMLKQDKITKGEPCFFAHGELKGKLIPFGESILKRISKQGIKAYPSTAMIGNEDVDEISRRLRQEKPAFVLEENKQEGRLYIIKFKYYDENSVRFKASLLKKKNTSRSYDYRLKKTGDVWKIEGKDIHIY